MLAIGYCRVSTDQQCERGVSVAAQAQKVRAMALVHGAELVAVIQEGGESAKTLDRPGMQRVLAMVERRQVQAVIVAKLDRLTRSVRDLCELLELLERRGVALISVAESLDTSSAAGRLVINIMAAVSQWEREAIGERTRDALRHKRSRGERVGNIAFGYRLAADGKHVEPDVGEQTVLEEIRRLRGAGGVLAEDRYSVKQPGLTNAPWHSLAAGTRGPHLCARLLIRRIFGLHVFKVGLGGALRRVRRSPGPGLN
jgi:DNA invertase Pin-like site-specific DNA recombinase